MSENGKEQEFARQAAEHEYFTESNVTDASNGVDWKNVARLYMESYSGNFSFVHDVRKQYLKGKTLSNKQLAGILNVARRAGKSLPKVEAQEVVDEKFAEIIDGFDDVPKVQELPEQEDLLVPVEDLSPTYLAAMKELKSRMLEIEASVKSLLPQIDPLDIAIKASQKEERDLLAEVQAKIEKLRRSRVEQEIEKQKIAIQIRELEEQLNKLRQEYALTVQQLAAEQKFSELRKKFEDIKSQQPWGESIMAYQWDDVCFMAAAFMEHKSGILNANDMGLGKTFESAALITLLIPLFIEKYGRHPRMLWLTKKSLLQSSFKEIHRWVPEQMIIVIEGQPKQRDFLVDVSVANNSLTLVNYDALNTTPALMNYEWDFIFADEVHALKGGSNPSGPTAIWKNTKQLVEHCTFFVPLSGSPIMNHPREMWAYLHLFAPDRFPTVKRFEREFCYGYPELKVNWEHLIKVMSDRVIRRSKKDVLTELPDKVRVPRYVELTGKQAEIYQKLRDEFFMWLDSEKTTMLSFTSILAKLTRLRQCAIIPASIKIVDEKSIEHRVECWESAKIDEAMEIVEELLGMEEQVVIYSSQFNEPLFHMRKLIEEKFNVKCEMMYGETTAKGLNQQIEERFQSGETRVLLNNLKTGGVGLNLQKNEDEWAGGASHAIFLDLWWNPPSNTQAEDRLHRKGQKDAVTIHVIYADNTVDAFIAAKLEEKEAMIDGIVEDESFRKSAKDWKDLLAGLI